MGKIRSDLPTAAKIQYGAFVFSSVAKTLSVTCRNVPDSARRTVTHKVITFVLQDWLQDDVNRTDNDVRALRRTLETPGDVFMYESAGFGPFTFSGTAATKDLNWGPFPEVLTWENQGAGNACRFTWTNSVSTLDAGGAQQGQPMEFCYDLSWVRDVSGYTTRTYAGHLIIPGRRTAVGARNLTDSADAYLEQALPPLSFGFRRETQGEKLSEDKCRIDFSVVDKEIGPNVWPEGVIDIDASHTMETDPGCFISGRCTIAASYEMMKTLDRRVAALHFIRLVASRLDAGLPFITGGGQDSAKLTIIPLRLSASEPQIYGRRGAAFSFSYQFTTTQEQLLQASGLWAAVPDTDWSVWQKSISPANAPRGLAGDKFQLGWDAVIDINAGRKPAVPGPIASKPVPKGAPNNLRDLLDHLEPENIKPENSWLEYRCEVNIEVIDEVAPLKPLPQQRVQQNADTADTATNKAGFRVPYAKAGGTGTILQLRAQPTIVATLRGKARRAKYPIDPPQLKAIAGVTPVLANLPIINGFRTETQTNLLVPINSAVWSLRYLLPNVPATQILPPDNPLLDPRNQ